MTPEDAVASISLQEWLNLKTEIDLLRRVVRAADYRGGLGQDSRYDEARKALSEFDRAAQEEKQK